MSDNLQPVNEGELVILFRIIYSLQERLRRTNGTFIHYGKRHKKIINKNFATISDSVNKLESMLAKRECEITDSHAIDKRFCAAYSDAIMGRDVDVQLEKMCDAFSDLMRLCGNAATPQLEVSA